MKVQTEASAEQIRRLQRCINDLISVLALPAMWSGGTHSQIVSTLLDSVLHMLCLDFVYLRLNDSFESAPTEVVRLAQTVNYTQTQQELCAIIGQQLGGDQAEWPRALTNVPGGKDISILPLRLGLQGELGLMIAGSQRTGFPDQTEELILGVAANQAAIGFQEARLLSEQRRVATELDRRVAQRTTELARANLELRKEVIERKGAEEKLRRSEAFLAEGQYLARIGSFSWLPATDDIRWSEQLYRIFEFEMDTLVTLERIGSRVHPDDLPTMHDMVDKAKHAAADFEYEHRLLMPDRSIKYLHLIAHVTRDIQGRLEYIGAVQDVTQRRSSEAALTKARSELAQVARATSLATLTASIAHEVNQPLSGIVTNAGTCLRMLAAEPPNLDGARETARRTIRDGNRASEVITRLRTLFSKKEIVAEAVDLNEATREVIALSVTEFQKNRILLRLEMNDLPPVLGDRTQLQQVVLNLLRNASEAMSAVDDRARELLVRTEYDSKDWVRLSVKDSGVGFDSQPSDKLFEAFYTTKNGGMGIGLSVSRSIIEAHHGRMWAEPNDGPGATFLFSLPRASA